MNQQSSFSEGLYSGEKQTPSLSNMQPHLQFQLCICGKVVLQKPITLSCGHQYHFRCAREHIFNQNDDDNNCLLCDSSGSQSSLNIDFPNSLLSNHPPKQDSLGVEGGSANSYQKEHSFKYLTPNTAKCPKRSRYSNYSEEQNTLQHSNHMGSFMLSPAIQTSLKSPADRVPFTDITAQLKKNTPSTNSPSISMRNTLGTHSPSIKNPLGTHSASMKYTQNTLGTNSPSMEYTQNTLGTGSPSIKKKIDLHQLTPEMFGDAMDRVNIMRHSNYIETLGESLIRISFERQSLVKEFFPNRFAMGQDQNMSGIENNSSDLSETHSISFSMKSSGSSSSGNCDNLQKSRDSFTLRKLCHAPQLMERSFNSSMLSIGSDKENVRTMTTRHTRNSIIQISFFEGMSFMCPDNIVSSASKQRQLKYPFSVQIENLSKRETSKFSNSQDILLVIAHNGMSSQQRYSLVKSAFEQLDSQDTLSIGWIDSTSNKMVKCQSDFFFGIEMSEVISKEFMRLQAHKESAFVLSRVGEQSISPSERKKSLGQFVNEQFASIQSKRMIQHCIVFRPPSQKLLCDIDISGVLISEIVLPDISGNDLLFSTSEMTTVHSTLQQLIRESKGINVKGIKLTFELNPFLKNLSDVILINSQAVHAKLNGLSQNHNQDKIEEEEEIYAQSLNCERIEEEEELIPKGKKVEVLIEFMRTDKVELLFEAQFFSDIEANYQSARLFNCEMNYSFLYVEKEAASSSNTLSLIPRTSVLRSRSYQEIKQKLTDLYLLIDWRKENNHLAFNRKVVFSFWSHEVAVTPVNQQHEVYLKYKPIFELISKKKQTTDYDEFKQFTAFYESV